MKKLQLSLPAKAVYLLLRDWSINQRLNRKADISVSKSHINNVLHLADIHSQKIGHEPVFNWIQKGVMWYSIEINEGVERLVELGLLRKLGNSYYCHSDLSLFLNHDIRHSVKAYSDHLSYQPKYLEKKITQMRKELASLLPDRDYEDIEGGLEEYWEVQRLMMEEKPSAKKPGFLL